MLPVFLAIFVSRLFPDMAPSCSLVSRVHLSSVFHSRVTSLSFPRNFFSRLSCFSSLSFLLIFLFVPCFLSVSPLHSVLFSLSLLLCFNFAFLTEDGRYLKSQGGATGHSVPCFRPSSQRPTPLPHSTKSSDSTPCVLCCPCATHLDEPSLIWLEHKVATREKVTRVNNRGPALTLTQPRLAERFCHGYISPKFGNYPLNTSGQILDEVAPFRDFRDQTTVRNGLQCPDHRSFLPRSPERIRIFH